MKTTQKNPDSEAAEAPFEQEIRAACSELADFLVEKNRTYGNSIIEPMSVFAKRLDRLAQLDVRIDDKLSRVKRGQEYPGDNDVKDLAGYFVWKMIIAKMES